MWHRVAPALAEEFVVVCADLRGYGASGTPPSTPDHAPYAKAAMAGDMVAVMEHLGFDRFSVVGHDRGGRVAYRLALDHETHVEKLAVLDVVPTSEALDRADESCTSTRCAIPQLPTRSARSTERPQPSTMRRTVGIAQPSGRSTLRPSYSGRPQARLTPGTKSTAGRSASGAPGQLKSEASRCPAGTSSPSRIRTTPVPNSGRSCTDSQQRVARSGCTPALCGQLASGVRSRWRGCGRRDRALRCRAALDMRRPGWR